MTLTPTQQEKIIALKNAMDRSFVNESDITTSFSDNPSDAKVASEKLVKDSLDNHTHTKSQITDFPTEAKFITGAFVYIESNVIMANTSETTPTSGDRFYLHITNISTSTTDARIGVIYNNQYNVNGAVYRNGTALKPNELKADTILLIELVHDNGDSWNIIEAFNGNIAKEQSYPIVETLNTKLGDEWAYVVSEVIHSGRKALCKITNLSSSELSLNDKIYIKIPSYQTDSNNSVHIQLSDASGTTGLIMFDANNQTIKESDINGKIIYATYGGSQFVASNIYSTSRLMALISELPTKTSDLQNDSGFLTSHQSLTGYLQQSDVKDNLTSTDTNKPLSANQGKQLKSLVDNKLPYSNGTYLMKMPYYLNGDATNFSATDIGVNGSSDFPIFALIKNTIADNNANATLKFRADGGNVAIIDFTNSPPSPISANVWKKNSWGLFFCYGSTVHLMAIFYDNNILDANYIQKSQTSGLLKNDGSIDTNTYLTSSAISGMLTTSDTVDNLTTNDSTKPLSAKQGKALNDMIGSAITYIVGSDN